jgi:hypothetical protein
MSILPGGTCPGKSVGGWPKRVFPCQSPHRFRHGHATYALKWCEDVADLKAVSQDLMHSSLILTHSIYSCLRRTLWESRCRSHVEVAKRDTAPTNAI